MSGVSTPQLEIQGEPGLPPGPKGHFLVGSLPEVARDWASFVTECAREYGDVVSFRLFRTPMCLLSHPDHIEDVLVTNHHNFIKSKDYRAVRGVFGDGLLVSEGDFWRRQRRLMQPAFHNGRVASYAETMVLYAERMLARWRDGQVRDVHQDMMQLTMEIVAKALFGADVTREAKHVGTALQVLLDQFSARATTAFLIPSGLPVPGELRYRRAIGHLEEIIYGMIRERRANGGARDLLTTLLEAEDEDGNRMTDRQVRDEVMTLFLAGHETTAIALSWTWYLLALHPTIESRLAEEIRGVLGGRPPTMNDLPRLQYADWVVKESLRLYPPVWGIGRESLDDFQIGPYRLPAGTNVVLCQGLVHRDPRFFDEPERFIPERWVDDPIRHGRMPRFAYFPFGGGPRICIGASFAMLEATLLLVTILQKYHLSLVPGFPVIPRITLTHRPKNGICVILSRRRG